MKPTLSILAIIALFAVGLFAADVFVDGVKQAVDQTAVHTESDPVAATSVWDHIQYPLALTNATAFATAAQGTSADTAFGWGDHGTNDYTTTGVVATQVWSDAQYPNAVLVDGSRARTGDQDYGGYSPTNASTYGFTNGSAFGTSSTNPTWKAESTNAYLPLAYVSDVTTEAATRAAADSTHDSEITAVESHNTRQDEMLLDNYMKDLLYRDLAGEPMPYGWNDAFTDETGIDTAASTNQSYDSSNDLYEPTPGSSLADAVWVEWQFEETSGTNFSATIGGSDFDGTTSHDLSTLTASGIIGNGFSFDESATQWADWSTNANNEMFFPYDEKDFTISFWGKSTANTGYDAMIEFGSVAVYYNNPSGVYFYYNNHTRQVYGSTDYGGDNTWHHVVAMHSNGTSIVYVDNVVIDTGTVTSGPVPSGTVCTFGIHNNKGVHPMGGVIDQVVVFNRALTGPEVSHLYNSGSGTTNHFIAPGAPGMTLYSTIVTNTTGNPTEAILKAWFEDDGGMTINTSVVAQVSNDAGVTKDTVTLEAYPAGDITNFVGASCYKGTVSLTGGTNEIQVIGSITNAKIHGWQIIHD